ncbi:MAG TPA: hypothetical protein VM223_17845 [Planctomycetota bacterium]|nr:hypothetical protein [Planctomycetota bacterium]
MSGTGMSWDAFIEWCLAFHVMFSSLFVMALFISARRQRRRA